MKKLFALIISLLLLAEVMSPTMAQQHRHRHKSWFGRKSRTVAIIGGGTAVGALAGGKKGAAIGAGGAGLYAFNRRAARRHFKGSTRTIGTVASGTALGGGTGAAIGGKKGGVIGALAGAGTSYVVRKRHARRRY